MKSEARVHCDWYYSIAQPEGTQDTELMLVHILTAVGVGKDRKRRRPALSQSRKDNRLHENEIDVVRTNDRVRDISRTFDYF